MVVIGDSVLHGDHDYGNNFKNMPFLLSQMLQETNLLKDKVEVYNIATAERTVMDNTAAPYRGDRNWEYIK